ncbi:helix-turn-helix transcriptional regulator [Phormidium sp. CCY1219]|uniref:helix-turn-helix transcriptional regulator n=1 Tax=Phormidium sp. CCY1219 TaxID=2886104 RepID=UPI002D1EAF22|nr:metalloregulator ArsR/SmtB family transcription factor [Phormidium sp. CCY1219]MEB3831240.1 transcriptional regulator [Phormidium sp. CCY1219]
MQPTEAKASNIKKPVNKSRSIPLCRREPYFSEEMEEKQKAKDRILYLLKMQGGQSATELAEQLQVSPMAVRQHLQALLADGLVSYQEQRRPIGRPVKLWQLTPASTPLFPDTHQDLMVDFLKNFETLFGKDALERVLAERTHHQIQSYQQQVSAAPGEEESEVSQETRLGQIVTKLAQIRSEEGYMAEAIFQSDGSWLLVENHCPIRGAAIACGQFCRSELEVFKTLFGPQVYVERSEHIIQGDRRCAYKISLNSQG